MKLRMRLFMPFFLLCLSLQPRPANALFGAGDIVFDPTHTAETIVQITQLATQITQIYETIQLAQTHLDKISGLRGMESLLSSVYDNEFDSVLDDIDGILEDAGLGGAEEILGEEETRFLRSKEIENELYDEENALAAKWEAQSAKYLDSTVDRFSELVKLIHKLTGTQDQKDVMDLQARAISENSMLMNEQMKMQMVMSQLQAEEKVLARKKRQESIEAASGDVNYDGLFEGIDWDTVFD